MMRAKETLLCVGVVLVGVLAVAAGAGDWPQFGRTGSRNMVSPERGLPARFSLAGPASRPAEVLWTVKLGPLTYGHPTVAGGRVFVGTGDGCWRDPRAKRTGGGMLVCVDEKSGKILWRLLARRYSRKIFGSNFDDLKVGICSCATVEGDRAYVVTNRAEVLCLDVRGQADGNDGPFLDEGPYMAGAGGKPVQLRGGDADIVWRFDMIALPTAPHDATNCNVLIHGRLVYACTSNGVHRMPDEPNPLPDAPSLIALDKATGRLVAADGEKIARRVFHGQWSSPSLCKAGGREMILFGAGDGVLYAFAPAAPAPAAATRPAALKKVWQYDCTPAQWKRDEYGDPIDYWDGDASRTDVPDGWLGPSEIIATPVAHGHRVYVAVGRDPEHGVAPGVLHCIDARGKGDITKSGRVWSYRGLSRTMSTVSIADGLLYVADLAGAVHCLDADTGKVHWVHETNEPIWSATLVADGRVYVTTEERNLWVFRAAKAKTLVAKIRLPHEASASPVAANGVLYLATHRRLYALRGTAQGQ